MIEKLKTAESLASVASAQEIVLNSWKDVENEINGKRNRLVSRKIRKVRSLPNTCTRFFNRLKGLLNHWKSMLGIVRELRNQVLNIFIFLHRCLMAILFWLFFRPRRNIFDMSLLIKCRPVPRLFLMEKLSLRLG